MYKAKIYKVVCSHCDKVYIGSTAKSKLCERMWNHRSSCNQERKRNKFVLHMREQGLDKFGIFLIEEIEVKNFNEQRIEEQKKIEELNTIGGGFNNIRAYVSPEIRKEEKKNSNKIYRENPENKIKYNIYRRNKRMNAPKKHKCIICDYKTGRLDTFKRHLKGKWHLNKLSIIPTICVENN